MNKPLLIGAHTSAAGGAPNALREGLEIGATTIQFFTSNQKQWQPRKISESEVSEWKELLKETGISHVMSHASYLVNLGSPKKDGLVKSRTAFRHELERCHLFNVTYLNFHPGAALDGTEEECLDTIVESLLELENLADKGFTRLLLEATAGQGSSVGHRFEQLGYIIDKVHKRIPIGVCIDTCHIFVAGYDIRNKKGWDTTLEEFDKIVGLKHLYALHVNDSVKKFSSRSDRHASLGDGQIGMECFKIMMTHPKLRDLPKYLETPEGPPVWKKEIALLRKFAQ
jgi:deoxyribonuclease-4